MEDYDIERKKLGKGSFGTVFKGVDKKSGLKVALKFSHNHLQASAMDGARAEAVMMQMVRAWPTTVPRSGRCNPQSDHCHCSFRYLARKSWLVAVIATRCCGFRWCG